MRFAQQNKEGREDMSKAEGCDKCCSDFCGRLNLFYVHVEIDGNSRLFLDCLFSPSQELSNGQHKGTFVFGGTLLFSAKTKVLEPKSA